MPTTPASIPVERLRRVALAAQGLNRRNPFGRGKNAVLLALQQLGYAQIDTISVVARAHHHVLGNRIANYKPSMLNALVLERSAFEYWFHAAAYLPMSDYRFALPRMTQVRAGRLHFTGQRDPKTQRAVLARIRDEGALAARDFAGDGSRGGWWDWKPAKRALELLFLQGDLMVSGRDGFEKRYDLRERVLPAGVNTQAPTPTEYAEHQLAQCLRTFGVVTVPQASYLRRSAELRAALQRTIDERVSQRLLSPVAAADGGRWYVDTEALDARLPQLGQHTHILSPFDPLVIQRKRTAALFGFDYLIECYVPAAKRQFGYFCLPILYRDEFIGRMDCKAHRQERVLALKALHLEPAAKSKADLWLDSFASALCDYAQFNQCQRIELPSNLPRKLRSALQQSVRQWLEAR